MRERFERELKARMAAVPGMTFTNPTEQEQMATWTNFWADYPSTSTRDVTDLRSRLTPSIPQNQRRHEEASNMSTSSHGSYRRSKEADRARSAHRMREHVEQAERIRRAKESQERKDKAKK